MHNCRETKERFTELILDGRQPRSDEVLSAEVNGCGECRAEFETLSATLRITSRLRDAAAPAESYWTGYHEQLQEKLLHAQNESDQFRAKAQKRKVNPVPPLSLLRLCARAFLFPVPVPLGIAVLVAGSVLALFTVRAARRPAIHPPPPPIIVQVPVEVPVVQEKIVTQVVYRERWRGSKPSGRVVGGPIVESAVARSQKPGPDDVHQTLSGFKPTDEVKLTVIKGGSQNEK